jgi:small subunit ribosomal protein S20
MPNIKSAEKRVRQSQKRYVQNRKYRSSARTAVKKARLMLANGDESAGEAVAKAIQVLDKAAQKGVIHANNAARRKSRLMQALHKTQSA